MTDTSPPETPAEAPRRRQDPLSARADTILEQARYTALQIELTTLAHPWLVKAGMDPLTAPQRLRELAEQARGDGGRSRLRTRLAHLPWIDVEELMPRVRQWQSVVRKRLRGAAPEAARAVRELRGVLRPTAHRLVGSMTMLQSVIPMFKREADVLGAGVDVSAIVAEATALLEALEQATSARGETADVRKAAAAVAREAMATLRAELKLIRLQWRLARDLSGGTIAKLDLGLARADVASRGHRHRKQP